MRYRVLAGGLSLIILGAVACVDGDRQALSPDGPSPSTLPATQQPAGLVLGVHGASVMAVDSVRHAPTIPEGVSISVYEDGVGGTLGVVDSVGGGKNVQIESIVADDSQHCRAAITLPDSTLALALSGTDGCKSTLEKLANAIIESPADWTSTMSREASDFVLTDASATSVGVGYALTYGVEGQQVTLIVNPVSGPVSLSSIDSVAALAFIQRDGQGEYLATHTYGSEPWRLVWLQDGFLVQLVGELDFVEAMRPLVTSIADDPVNYSERHLAMSISATADVDRASVAGFIMTRKEGPPGSSGGVCLADSLGTSTCAEFSAVGSLASLSLNGIWYLVAVVPRGTPTTTYRTTPELRSESGTGTEWIFSVAAVPSDVSGVTAYYTTTGVGHELETTWQRPGR
jgi:hypothetical protein